MGRMLTLAAISLGLLLTVACSSDEPPPATPAWTVVATQETLGENSRFYTWYIEYIGPTSDIFTWSRIGGYGGSYHKCWSTVRIGDPLPDCARSEPPLSN